MKRFFAFILAACLVFSVVSVAFAEDNTDNYKDYSFHIQGGGNTSSATAEKLKKYVSGNAVVRLNTLTANDSKMSGYGWADVYSVNVLGSLVEVVTSTSGNDNKVSSGGSRNYLPYKSGKDVTGIHYKMKMRTPTSYSSSITYYYAGSWSPDM